MIQTQRRHFLFLMEILSFDVEGGMVGLLFWYALTAMMTTIMMRHSVLN